MRKVAFILLILVWSVVSVSIHAQVTIGSSLKPLAGALLDLKEFDSSNGAANAEKGLLLPKVLLTDLKSLIDIEGVENAQHERYIGMIVYNVNAAGDPCNTIPQGVFLWDGVEWVGLTSDDTGVSEVRKANLEDLKALQRIKDNNTGNTISWNIDLENSTYLDPDSRLNFGGVDCNNQRLIGLNVTGNNLSNLNVSAFDELIELKSSNNNIYDLDVRSNRKLEVLESNGTHLSRLDLSQNRDLKVLAINDNRFSNQGDLDLSQNWNLERFELRNNNLHSVNISQNRNLKILYASNNQLDALDVTQHAYLLEIDCSNNRLSSLNPSMSYDLHTLYCNDSLLAQLDLKNNKKLENLSILNNEALLRTSGSVKVCRFTWESWATNANIAPGSNHIAYDASGC